MLELTNDLQNTWDSGQLTTGYQKSKIYQTQSNLIKTRSMIRQLAAQPYQMCGKDQTIKITKDTHNSCSQAIYRSSISSILYKVWCVIAPLSPLYLSTFAQVMAWCLIAPSHYLSKCWKSLFFITIPKRLDYSYYATCIFHNNYYTNNV